MRSVVKSSGALILVACSIFGCSSEAQRTEENSQGVVEVLPDLVDEMVVSAAYQFFAPFPEGLGMGFVIHEGRGNDICDVEGLEEYLQIEVRNSGDLIGEQDVSIPVVVSFLPREEETTASAQVSFVVARDRLPAMDVDELISNPRIYALDGTVTAERVEDPSTGALHIDGLEVNAHFPLHWRAAISCSGEMEFDDDGEISRFEEGCHCLRWDGQEDYCDNSDSEEFGNCCIASGLDSPMIEHQIFLQVDQLCPEYCRADSFEYLSDCAIVHRD